MIFVIPYFFLELYFSLSVGEKIGFFWTVIWIVSTFIIGMGLLQNAHMAILGNLKMATAGKLNSKSFQDASTSYLVGAILFIIPGVLSDFLGLIALFYTIFLQIGGTIPTVKNKTNIKKTDQQGDDDVIDVEIIECDTLSNTKP